MFVYVCVHTLHIYMFVYSENISGRIHKKQVIRVVSGENYRWRMRQDLVFYMALSICVVFYHMHALFKNKFRSVNNSWRACLMNQQQNF